ncbi:hypothetical protein QO003_001201 [Arthrobacter silviterrae]|nr:hypothetical protein [Arthrobacter silviterrae]
MAGSTGTGTFCAGPAAVAGLYAGAGAGTVVGGFVGAALAAVEGAHFPGDPLPATGGAADEHPGSNSDAATTAATTTAAGREGRGGREGREGRGGRDGRESRNRAVPAGRTNSHPARPDRKGTVCAVVRMFVVIKAPAQVPPGPPRGGPRLSYVPS